MTSWESWLLIGGAVWIVVLFAGWIWLLSVIVSAWWRQRQTKRRLARITALPERDPFLHDARIWRAMSPHAPRAAGLTSDRARLARASRIGGRG
jgi:hypothetical protein